MSVFFYRLLKLYYLVVFQSDVCKLLIMPLLDDKLIIWRNIYQYVTLVRVKIPASAAERDPFCVFTCTSIYTFFCEQHIATQNQCVIRTRHKKRKKFGSSMSLVYEPFLSDILHFFTNVRTSF